MVSQYLAELLDAGSSYHTLPTIKWTHELNGLEDHTDISFVKNLLESFKRTAKELTQKKDPVSTELIVELYDKYKMSVDL